MIVESKSRTYTLKDSAADSKLKLLKEGETFGVEKPGGEKRLHIGSINNEKDFDNYFFPNGEEKVIFEVSKLDLIQYLLSAEDEYTNPVQSYRLPINEYYFDLLEYIWNIEKEFFTIPFEKNVDKARYYLSRPISSPDSKNYLFINRICLPIVTTFNLIRNKYDDGTYKFYLKPVFVSPSPKKVEPVDFVPCDNLPLQQIFYGAPGTGKSQSINEHTKGESVIRTTFHPDSDYSTFVGAYKPTMGLLPICDELGQPMKIGSTVLHKEQIMYEFVEQAFLQAYVRAWKNIVFNEGKKQYLIIEEINRGNCAQIFGDLFQLLDRNEYGFSDYPIQADKDMQKFLKKAFARTDEPDKQIFLKEEEKQRINQLYKDREDVMSKVFIGEILLLPNNLFIWATMNTSDQSLFPIDSAFKRRWDWKYVPISNKAEMDYSIDVDGTLYDWWDFLSKVNTAIGKTTESEDKKLGYFFCKADKTANPSDKENNVISADRFVSKAIFYIWNDVMKDYDPNEVTFEYKVKSEDGKDELTSLSLMTYKVKGENGEERDVPISFSDFFKGAGDINLDTVKRLMDNLKIKTK